MTIQRQPDSRIDARTSAARWAFYAKLRLTRDRSQVFTRMLESQHLPPDIAAERQRADALSIAAFAAHASPFYSDLYASAGITSSDLAVPATFEHLPLVTRTLMRENSAHVATEEYSSDTAEERRTGGSTGEPLAVATDRRFPSQALVWRMYSWWGIQPYDNAGHLGVWAPSRAEYWRYLLRWWPTRHEWVNPGLLNNAVIDGFLRRMQASRSAVLEGYVGAVAETARYAEGESIRLPDLLAIAVTAAPLTQPIREDIQRGLGARVYDVYRTAEVPFLAAECREQRGLHVFADHRVLEIVDDDDRPVPHGTEGSVVVTDLRNRVFPIIRYRLGDRGRYLTEQCPCGVTLPLLEAPQGRLSTVLRLPDGTALASGIAGFFAGIPDAVRQYRIHQRADYSISISVVLGSAPDAPQQVDRVVAEFRQRVRGMVPVTVEVVDQIPHERGKIRFVICDVPDPT